MANLGVINAHPSEPPSDEEVIKLANRLLSEFNIPTTIESIDDICAALFVLLYENLFSDRLVGIIRQPVTKEDEIHNCQTVIDVLSSDIVRDSLSHIRGVDIIHGDITAISNLLDIFSYLLDYVANKIESDIGTDTEDGESLNAAEVSARSGKSKKSALLGSRDNKTASNKSNTERTKQSNGLSRTKGRNSPEIDRNDNKSAVSDNFSLRLSMKSPSVTQDDLGPAPSPIRPDDSQSLLGQKTVDSVELDRQFGKEDPASFRGSPAPKTAFDGANLNSRCVQPDTADISGDAAATVAGVVTSTSPTFAPATPATLHDLEPDGITPRAAHIPYMSRSMPPPQDRNQVRQEVPMRSTVGPISVHSPRSQDRGDYYEREPAQVKGLSSSYNELRHLVERTAAMSREALMTSPAHGRFNKDLNVTDTSDRARPQISSEGVRLARELNAREMRKGESSPPPSKCVKKVAFTSLSDRTDNRPRYPFEELRENGASGVVTADSLPGRGRRTHTLYSRDDEVEENYRLREQQSSPNKQKFPKKTTKTEEFAKHLARNRQPELGAAHMTLKTEDRAIKKRQEFLQRLYAEDLGEFSEDVNSLLEKEQRKSKEKEKQLLKSYQDSKPRLNGPKKTKSSSKPTSFKKAKLATNKMSKTNLPGNESTPSPSKLECEDDLLPFLLNEFPHLHLSDHTWHELCRSGLQQIEAITRVYQENKRKKSKAQLQLEEAANRQELLSNIMRKELEQTKRMRELKEQKAHQVQVQNKTREKRVQSARARRYYNDYQVRARSKQLKRRTVEEMVFRDLFKDAMKIQKERIKDIRQYATDQRKSQETRRQNEMESLENFYHDQFQMLAEKIAKERQEGTLREKAQQQMVDRIKRELRKKIESEICLYQEQMFRDDDDAHFRQMDADRAKKQLHMARYAAQI